MATWTEASLLTGERDEHLVVAVGATDAGEAVVQIAAAKESTGHVTDDPTPRAVLFGVTPFIGPLELRQVTLDGLKKRRLSRSARAVNRFWVGGEADHGDDAWKGLGSEARDMRLNKSQRGFATLRFNGVERKNDQHAALQFSKPRPRGLISAWA